ncbi:nucleoside 2-deoxyribosyltransferase [Burkholderia dolosa]|uniref:nucleoside 2-deoxyribosyltransferase n=1 Tax=Burkholderia dolosa TaxID=152500 RepID=UPI001B9F093C|nr:nucleoside 2-deoxyribosyltransferase [Burkholderia dolosa]MBR8311964.1 nucleoside 2-deoxyribosyltransferase [Burkholderia dolosa]
MTRPVVYLAGVGLFRQDADDYGASLKAPCAEFAFKGIFPLDAELERDVSPAHQAHRI